MSNDQLKNEQDSASGSGYPERELYPNRKSKKHRDLQRDVNEQQQQQQQQKSSWIGVLLAVIVIALMVYNAYMDKKVREEAEANPSGVEQTEPLSEEEAAAVLYKENSVVVAYAELMANPQEYEGKIVKFSGEVIEVLEDTPEEGYFTYGINVTKGEISWGDGVYVTFDVPSATKAFAKDWNLTFYGEFKGIIDYEAEVGGMVSLPWVDAKYIDRN
ncbi:MAG TPA: hypothetical protein GXZ59_07695 [Clostridiaceae bacterium]|nr:hypothetical protein [Clostridiaceae bacterium]